VFFAQGKETDKYQDMVIEFNSSGKVGDLRITISHNQVQKILGPPRDTTGAPRQLILKFIENIHTAYYRKDKAYLNKVYSSNDVSRHEKEYFKKLKNVLSKDEYINFKFEDIDVAKHENNPNIYGVTLRQKWSTSTYNDEGWLFLIIDFTDENKPLIQGKKWLPYEKTPKKVFSLSDLIE